MSPTNAALYKNLQNLEGTNLQTANNLATAAQSRLSTPLDLSQYQTTAAAPTAADINNNWVNSSWETPFNTTWSNQQKQLDQKLADQGVAPGSAAYGNAEYNFSQNQQQSLDSYSSSMYGTAAQAAQNNYNETLATNAQNAGLATEQYNQPLNELAALQAGTQIATPSFTPVTSTTVPTTDYASIANSSYQNQLAAYNAQQGASASTYGGLFGLGGSLVTAGGLMLSDRRLKRDIERIGTTAGGVPVYSYRFLWSDTPQIGVMADEVAHLGAVFMGADGFARVDYARIF